MVSIEGNNTVKQSAKIVATFVIFLLLVFLHSCKVDEVALPVEPQIELIDLSLIKADNGTDSMIWITLSFQDGDGDIGLGENDSLPPFNYGSPFFHNLPLDWTYYDSNSNSYKPLLNPITSGRIEELHERVPNLTPEGKNKRLTGSIVVKIVANPRNTKPKQVKLHLKLIDRALNISNEIETEPILLSH